MKPARSLPALFARDPEPPIERAALVLACDHDPDLDVDAWVARLDDLAAPLARRMRDAMSPVDQAALLGTFVYDELGFHGNETQYYDPQNSLLHKVIETRQGIPITLAAVLMAIGARAGIDVEGVGFPGHFLVRVGGPGGVMIDPFFHARVLDDAGLLSLLRRTQGPDATVQPEHLAPVGARAMIVRMLNNLRGIYGNHRDHARAMLACDRLYDLTDAPEFRRDRGLHAAALGLRDAALDDLRAYLAARPEASDAVTLRARVAELTAAATKRTLQ